jgi:hypothetical protein
MTSPTCPLNAYPTLGVEKFPINIDAAVNVADVPATAFWTPLIHWLNCDEVTVDEYMKGVDAAIDGDVLLEKFDGDTNVAICVGRVDVVLANA